MRARPWRSGLGIMSVILILADAIFTSAAFKLSDVSKLDDSFLDETDTFPHSLDITITYNDEQIVLRLEKNTYLDINVPGVAINKDGHGERILPSKQKAFQPYQDVSNGAAITVSCLGVDKKCQPVLVGSYFHDDEMYHLEPIFDPVRMKRRAIRENRPHHVYKRSHPNSDLSEIQPKPVTVHIKPGRRKTLRHRRQVVSENIVEILLVLDYEIYKRFFESIPAGIRSRDEINNKIKQYYFQVFNGMDMRYNYISANDFSLRIRLSNFIIAEEKRFSTWTENYVRNGTVDVTEVLKPFAETKEEIQRKYKLSPFDHAMAMSGYDLIFENKKTTLGYAYLNTTCQYWSVSFVEDRNDIMKTIWTASHELGHSLCSLHDGYQNSCQSHRKYIMTSTIDKPSRLTSQNPWKFSRCSVQYFREMLQKLDKQPINCLKVNSPPNFFGNAEWINHTSSHFGTLYNADEQCQRIHGKKSYMCREKITKAKDLCTNLWCHRVDPVTRDSECTPHLAAAGTTCGNKEWCQRGNCVFNQAASRIGQCPFGDQPGILTTGATCAKTVRDNPQMCDLPEFNRQCCQSCLIDSSANVRLNRGTVDVIVPVPREISRAPERSSSFVRVDPSHSLGTSVDVGYVTSSPDHSVVFQAPPNAGAQPDPGKPPVITSTPKVHSGPPRIARKCIDTGSPFNQHVVGCRGFKTFCYLPRVKKDCCATCQRARISPSRVFMPVDRSRKRREVLPLGKLTRSSERNFLNTGSQLLEQDNHSHSAAITHDQMNSSLVIKNTVMEREVFLNNSAIWMNSTKTTKENETIAESERERNDTNTLLQGEHKGYINTTGVIKGPFASKENKKNYDTRTLHKNNDGFKDISKSNSTVSKSGGGDAIEFTTTPYVTSTDTSTTDMPQKGLNPTSGNTEINYGLFTDPLIEPPASV